MPEFTVLTKNQIDETLAEMPGWEVSEGKLTADFVFPDFRSAFAFITQIAIEAETINHHPTWTNTYNHVSFSFSTHEAGNKITDLDIKMAKYISKTAKLIPAAKEQ